MKPQSVGSRAAERRAHELLARHSLTEPPIRVERIADAEQIAVVYEWLAPDTSSVLVRQPSGERIIGINARHHPSRRRFSLAHELGHAMLHFPKDPPATGDAVVDRPLEVLYRDRRASQGSNRIEIEANQFAASLLMPEKLVTERFGEALRSEPRRRLSGIINDLATVFDVSPAAMKFRLVNLHLIDPT